MAFKPLDTAIVEAIKQAKKDNPEWKSPKIQKELKKQGIRISERTVRKYTSVYKRIQKSIDKLKERRVLVIGDLHAPFLRRGYLEFCKNLEKEYNCNIVVFTGDVMDSHASSYHESDPDGLSAGDELAETIKTLKPWHKAFPNALVCVGNHDRMAMRKAFTSGISKQWVKEYKDVLECPTWDFQHEFEIDGVCYEHGEGQKLEKKMMQNRMSYVGGHRHSELYVVFSVSEHDRLFAMQIGWGGDQDSYSMGYAKNFKKGIVSAGVVLKNGTMPIAIPMPLMDKEK